MIGAVSQLYSIQYNKLIYAYRKNKITWDLSDVMPSISIAIIASTVIRQPARASRNAREKPKRGGGKSHAAVTTSAFAQDAHKTESQ